MWVNAGADNAAAFYLDDSNHAWTFPATCRLHLRSGLRWFREEEDDDGTDVQARKVTVVSSRRPERELLMKISKQQTTTRVRFCLHRRRRIRYVYRAANQWRSVKGNSFYSFR
jgi:hypothetical protein